MNKKILYIFLLFVGFLFLGKGYSQNILNEEINQKKFSEFMELYKKSEKGINYTISCTSTKETCYGDCDGTITVSLASGSPTYPITILLDADASCTTGDQTILNVMSLPYTFNGICGCGVDYSVVIIDNIGDVDGCSASVTGKAPITPFKTITNETCAGACNGSIAIGFILPATGAPYSHHWSNGALTSTIVGLCAGSYTDTIRDKDGCSEVFTWLVSAPPVIVVDSVVYDAVFCNGGTGTITVYASGGTPPYQYDIGLGGGWQASNTFSGLAAGTYTITIQDVTPCTGVTNPITIAENTPIILSAVVDSVSCFGLSDGSINLSVAGGQGPYTYNWSNSEITQDISGLIAGNYCVTVTDFYGCTSTACYDVYEPDVILITETHINPCFGAFNGSIDITVSGGSCASYTYLWSNGAITQDITLLAQGNYIVTVTDCNGCTNTLSIDLVQNPQITIGETHVNYPCNSSGCVGSINITVAGGTSCPGYTYSWSGPSGYTSVSEDIVNLCFGSYTVTVTDCAGCTQTRTITITRPTIITITLTSQTNVSCFGLCDGAINITPSGGGLPFTNYSWTGPNGFIANTQDVSNLCAGAYSVTVTNSAGCTRVRAINITEPPDITITLVSQTNVLCNGMCTGAIDLIVGGGTPGYTYSWTGPNGYSSTSLDITNLCAGVYDLTVTDTKPCTKTYSVTITEPPVITLSEIQTEVSCNGVCDGTISITAGGGTPGYTYNWTGPSGYSTTNEDLTNLCAGTYNLTVTDANGCTLDTLFTLAVPSLITISDSHIDLSCNGVCNGSIDLTVAGGNPCPNYTFNWTGPNGPFFTEDLTNLCAGTYDVTVTDCNSCTNTHSVTLIQPVGFTIIETHIDEICFGDCTGSIDITVVGGTAPYSYNWTGPGGPYATEDLSNLCAGVYDLTITDAALCTATLSVTITEPADITLSEVHQNIAPCFGNNNGWITVTAVGGTSVYTYDWSPNGSTGDGTPTYSDLAAGLYTVTVTDVPNGCTETIGPITIIQPADVDVASVDITDVLCFGGNTGSFTVHATGGNPPYQYSIISGVYQNDSTFSGLIAGTYTVTVMDVPGCTVTEVIIIGEPVVLTTGISHTDLTCNGNCNGTATANPAGGTLNYSYIWDNPAPQQITQTATGLCVGLVNVTVTDANGCTVSASTTIDSPPPFTAVISDSTMSCGSYQAAVAGTTFLPDGSGVSYTSTLTQTDFGSGQTITSASDISSICLNIEHSWLGDLEIRLICPSLQSITIHPFDPGAGSTRVGEPVFLGATGQPDQDNSDLTPGFGYDYCFMETGATYDTWSNEANTSTYTYTDNSGNNHANDFYLPSGSYLTQDNFTSLIGCPINGDWSIEITDNQGLDNGYVFSWLLNFDNAILPADFCNGTAVVTTVGGQAPFTYNWSNSPTNDTITNLCSGSYCVTVTDANTCTATTCVTIVDVNLNIDSFTVTDASCSGVCNGSATVNISGGFVPITYAWSNGGITQTINNLCAGQYIVTVTEDNGCTATDSIIINNSYSISSTFNITTPLQCNGQCTGAGNLSGSFGTAPPSFTWSPNAADITNSLSNMCEGNYYVTITDAVGCTNTDSAIFVAPPVISIDSESSTDVLPCNGSNNGTVTIVASGGTGNLIYDIGIPPVQINNGNFSGLAAGSYTVTVTDQNGCFVTSSLLVVSEPTPLIINSLTSTDVSPCNGDANGTITINVSGGGGTYTYDLGSASQPGGFFNGLNTGTYTITVTDNLGCSIIANPVTINEPLLLTSSFPLSTQVACGGGCTGSLTVQAAGGSGTYVSYVWNPNVGNTPTINNLCAGFYFVTITDDLGCSTTNQFEITDPSDLQLDMVSSTNPLCFGDCNGTATVVASGGTPPYIITWPDLTTGPTNSNLCDGSVIVNVEDFSLCTDQLIVDLIEPLQLSFTTSTTSPVCASDCNGTATAIPSGGTMPYSYFWDPNSNAFNQTTAVADSLCPGTYNVTVSDINGCLVAPQQVTITSPPILTGTLDITQNVTCNGVCDGVLTANPSGGVPPYTYEWSPNVLETAQVASNLCADSYNVTITDFNGCSIIVTQTLNQPSTVTAVITDSSQVGCQGNCSGTATVLAGGGTGPYSYFWDPNTNAYNQTTAIADSLCAGIYFVTVADFNGCTTTNMVTIIDTSNLTLSVVSTTPPRCFGDCNGSITVSATGGYPHSTWRFYQFLWDNGQIDSLATNLCAGDHIVTVTDDSLCSRTILINLANPPLLEDSMGLIPISCNTLCDGSAIVYPYGGTGAYSYVWDIIPNQDNDTIGNLCPNTYHVTVSDANSCSVVDSVSLAAPPALTVSISIIDSISCNSICDGSVAAIVAGGTPPYSFEWNNSQTNDTIIDLCFGVYDLTVTDAGNCSATSSVTIIEPPVLQVGFDNIVQINCGPGNCTGSATAVASGGTPGYDYQWDANAGNQNTDIANNLCGNIYNVVVTDYHGCTVNGQVTITDTSNVSISINNINHVTCSGLCNGSATVNATGGSFPSYTYLWDDPVATTTATVSNLCEGMWHVTVTDDNGCSRIDSVLITDAAAVIAIDSIVPMSCTGLCDASIILTPSGGTPFSGTSPYTYEWSIVGLTDSIATGLCPGTYYYTVRDSLDCQYNDSVTIVDPGSMQANLTIVDPILCHGVCNGSILTTPSGSLGPYTYSWSNGQSDSLAINLCAGMYYVTVATTNGQNICFVEDSILLTEPDALILTFDSIVRPFCNGDSTGKVMAVVSGGTPTYTYQWSANADNATTAMIDTLIADMYFITVTDANGCTLESNFELQDTSNIVITVIDSSMISCYGRCDGWAIVRATGGTPSVISPFYTYSWSNFQTDTIANNLCSGIYFVTATDSLSCKRIREIEITEPDSIIISLVDSIPIICATNCIGSLTVSVTGGTLPYFSYSWDNNVPDTVINNLCAGIHQFNVTDIHGCTDSLIYNLVGPDTLVIDITAQNALCSTGTNDGSLLSNVAGGVIPYTYLWSNDSTTQNIINLPFGIYHLSVTDAVGCQSIDSSEITASIIVEATARWDTSICYGDSVQIFGFGGNVFSWVPGFSLSDSTVFDPWAIPTQTTTYYFTAFDSICFDIDSVTIEVYPELSISAGPDLTVFADHGTIINATSNDPLAIYNWTPTIGLSDSTALAPYAEPSNTTDFILTASNMYGCVEVDTMTLTVIAKIPNGITPNGDGDNDVWIIDIVSKYPECEVEVYNRWGEQLFYSKGYPDNERWDGTYKGKPLPTGTYYYIINLHDTEQGTLPITGPITIMR